MRSFRVGALLASLAFSTAFACAAEATSKGSELWVNGVRVARFVVPVGLFSPANRAGLAASRLSNATSATSQGPYILVDGEAVYAVAEGDAKAAKSTPAALAAVWAKALDDALHLVPLKVEDEYVRLPVGGARTLKLVGHEAKSAIAVERRLPVASVTKTAGGIVVRATGLGHATITIQGATAMETVDVTVRPRAAILPKGLEVEVTGAPSLGSTVMGAVEGALKNNLTGMPGVKWKLGPIRSRSVESGRALDVPVRVTAEAPDAFPTTGVVSVRVKNVPLPRIQDESLWYSNDPETVRRRAHLFASTVRKGAAARLLYHHMNGTVNTLFLRVQAVNESDKPARVAITPGDSTPNKNPVTAGLEAG